MRTARSSLGSVAASNRTSMRTSTARTDDVDLGDDGALCTHCVGPFCVQMAGTTAPTRKTFRGTYADDRAAPLCQRLCVAQHERMVLLQVEDIRRHDLLSNPVRGECVRVYEYATIGLAEEPLGLKWADGLICVAYGQRYSVVDCASAIELWSLPGVVHAPPASTSSTAGSLVRSGSEPMELAAALSRTSYAISRP
eukprot:1831449-Prymnesium_polylepis.1